MGASVINKLITDNIVFETTCLELIELIYFLRRPMYLPTY